MKKDLIMYWAIVKHLDCPYMGRLASGFLLKETRAEKMESNRQDLVS